MNINNKVSILPPKLLPGDIIGIAAPSSPFDKIELYKGISILENIGFRVSIDDAVFNKEKYLAGTDSERADLINRLFADRSIKAVFCARGGFGSMRILPLLDYGSIKQNPKIFIGHSDISAILTALYLKCGLVTFHGPLLTSLKNADDKTIEKMWFALTKFDNIKIEPENSIIINSGIASGPVICGNLATLCHLTGTPFEPDYSGSILVFEEIGEALYRIDRMLCHMKLAGCFNNLSGLALGSFEGCGDIKDIYKIVGNIFSDLNIPILAGFKIGHGTTNLTIPTGLDATLDADKKILTFSKPAIT